MTDTPVDPFLLSPEQAAAKLEEMTAAFRGSKFPQDPQSQLNRFYDENRQKLEAGDATTRRKFDELAGAVANIDPVEAVMNGTLPEVVTGEEKQKIELASYLRSLGLRDDVVKEAIDTNSTVNQETHDAAKAWKAQHLKDQEWVKRYLNGDVECVKQMTLANIIVTQPVKGKAA